MFGFAAAGFCLLLLSAAETTALITYYTLCAENYNWWWRAFLAPATTGLYVFVYAAYYYSSHLEGGSNLSFCLYFGRAAARESPLDARRGTAAPGTWA